MPPHGINPTLLNRSNHPYLLPVYRHPKNGDQNCEALTETIKNNYAEVKWMFGGGKK